MACVDWSTTTSPPRLPHRTRRPAGPGPTQHEPGELRAHLRIRSSKIPDLLDQLEVSFPKPTEKDRTASGPPSRSMSCSPPTWCPSASTCNGLASWSSPVNPRPQLSTSRPAAESVDHPGFVVTVLNWALATSATTSNSSTTTPSSTATSSALRHRSLPDAAVASPAYSFRSFVSTWEFNPATQDVKGAGQFAELTGTFCPTAQDFSFRAKARRDWSSCTAGAHRPTRRWAGEAAIPNQLVPQTRKKDDVTVPLLKRMVRIPGARSPHRPRCARSSGSEARPSAGGGAEQRPRLAIRERSMPTARSGLVDTFDVTCVGSMR